MSISMLGRMGLSYNRPANLRTFLYGCAYYPEHWDENIRKADPKLMQEAGMNAVRMGEFAWTLMEPQNGKYEFGLFDSVIENLGKEGIDLISGTKTGGCLTIDRNGVAVIRIL